jgi:hypothetical protein
LLLRQILISHLAFQLRLSCFSDLSAWDEGEIENFGQMLPSRKRNHIDEWLEEEKNSTERTETQETTEDESSSRKREHIDDDVEGEVSTKKIKTQAAEDEDVIFVYLNTLQTSVLLK